MNDLLKLGHDTANAIDAINIDVRQLQKWLKENQEKMKSVGITTFTAHYHCERINSKREAISKAIDEYYSKTRPKTGS